MRSRAFWILKITVSPTLTLCSVGETENGSVAGLANAPSDGGVPARAFPHATGLAAEQATDDRE
jgi:hypothetical protein